MMRTRELAESLVGKTADEIERIMVHFLVDFVEGYGANEGERGKARARANIGGYFWLPCILCGKWHGGHEIGDSGVMLTEHIGHGICDSQQCKKDADRLNKASGFVRIIKRIKV